MRAVTIGSAMIDIITIVDPERIERMTLVNEHKSFLWLESGLKIPAQSISTHVGGGACNTAVSLARRGWDVEALTKVGPDRNAEAVREHLAKEGVGAARVLVSEHTATGVSSMIASHDRNATIFVHRGANERMKAEDCEPGFQGVDLVHIAPLSSGSAEALPAFVRRGRADGAFVALNPGIRQLTGRGRIILDMLDQIDLLSLNRVEAEALVPALAVDAPPPGPVPPEAPELMRRGLHMGGFEMCLSDFAASLRKRGLRHLLVTDGAHGAYLAGPEGLVWRPPAPTEVSGTAGAGDAFTSTLGAALVEGVPQQRALAQAAVNAASVISSVDTTDGLLSRDALEAAADALGDAMWLAEP